MNVLFGSLRWSCTFLLPGVSMENYVNRFPKATTSLHFQENTNCAWYIILVYSLVHVVWNYLHAHLSILSRWNLENKIIHLKVGHSVEITLFAILYNHNLLLRFKTSHQTPKINPDSPVTLLTTLSPVPGNDVSVFCLWTYTVGDIWYNGIM